MIYRKRWLCIAYAFPPINRSGTHRTLSFVKHLSRLGWDGTVLTVKLRGESIDHELTSEIPRGTNVIRTKCFDVPRPFGFIARWRRRRSHKPERVERARCNRERDESFKEDVGAENQRNPLAITVDQFESWFRQALQLPDSKVGWFLSAFPIGLRAALRDRPHVIYSTSPYMTAHLLAMAISALTRIPWVADFRDPWTANPFRNIEFSSLQRVDAWLESLVLRRASRIVCTTPTMLDSFASRGANIRAKAVCIPNGIDIDLWRNARPTRVTSPSVFTFVHAGQFYGRRSPAALFEGLRRSIGRHAPSTEPIRLVLVGSDRFDGKPLTEIAKEHGVGNHAIVLGPRDHRETMSLIAGADANVLVGANGPGGDMQVPNKLFEYLGAKRPILALIDPQNPAIEILTRSKADARVVEANNLSEIAEAISSFPAIDRRLPAEAWGGVDQYSRERRAIELEHLFRQVAQTPLPHAHIATLNPVHS